MSYKNMKISESLHKRLSNIAEVDKRGLADEVDWLVERRENELIPKRKLEKEIEAR